MLLSVIIPIYNVEKYVRQCIDSVIRQRYKNLEIILVDDGSIDGCGSIVDQYKEQDSRVIVIHKENGGLLSARAAGAEVAHGNYLIFVDGDDWIDPFMYENLMRKMIECHADWITSGCYRVVEDRMIASFDRQIAEGFYDKSRMEIEIYPIMMHDERIGTYALDPSTCFKIYRKEILLPILQKLENHQFYYGEDSAISYLYALQANSMVCTNDKYYFHRQRPEKTTPDYLMDDKYFDKLLECYNYIKEEISHSKYHDIMSKQLDLFFARSANYKRTKYGLTIEHRKNYFLFPFDIIPYGSPVVIYGAGAVGRDYQKQLQKIGWDMVAWVDQRFDAFEGGIQNPEVISKIDFDYIVVAIVDDEVYATIKKWLNIHGINDEKIIHKIYRCSL